MTTTLTATTSTMDDAVANYRQCLEIPDELGDYQWELECWGCLPDIFYESGVEHYSTVSLARRRTAGCCGGPSISTLSVCVESHNLLFAGGRTASVRLNVSVIASSPQVPPAG